MPVNVLATSVTEVDIVNTTTETDLLSYTVLANALSSNGAVRVYVVADYLNNTAATASTVTIKIKYGSTTMYQDATISFPANLPDRYTILFDLVLSAKGATNSQSLAGRISVGVTGGATTGIAGNLATDEINAVTPLVGANASEDSTGNLDFKITITHQSADTAISFRHIVSTIEQLSPITNYSVGFDETVTLSATVDRVLSNQRTVSDTVSQSDSEIASKGANRIITETVTRNDSVTRLVGLQRTYTDDTSSSDSLAMLRSLPRSFSNTISLSDSLARSVTFDRSVSDTTTLSDTLARIYGQPRSFTEDVDVGDLIEVLSLANTVFFDESVDVSDNWERAAIDFNRWFRTPDTSAIVYDDYPAVYEINEDNVQTPNQRLRVVYRGENPEDDEEFGKVGVRVPAGGAFPTVLYEYPYPTVTDTEGSSASLVLTEAPYYSDFDVTFSVRTIEQKKVSPNAWETAWFFWHFNEAHGNNFHQYYVAFKTNQTEFGRKDNLTQDEYQNFFFTGGTGYTIGTWYEIRIRAIANRFTMWKDGTEVFDITDDGTHIDFQDTDPFPGPTQWMSSGKFGFYNEDAEVEFSPLIITSDYKYWDDVTVGSGTFTRSSGPHRDMPNTITTSDSFSRSEAELREFTDTTTLSDTFLESRGQLRAIADTILMSDVFATSVGKIRDITNTITIGAGTFARALGLSRTFSDTTPQSDSFSRKQEYARTFLETIVVGAGSFARRLGLLRFPETEEVLFSDTFVSITGRGRFFEETIEVSDSWSRIIGLSRSISNTTVISDNLLDVVGSPRSFTETTVISDTFSRRLDLNRIIPTEGNIAVDMFTRVFGSERTITDTTAVTSALTRNIILNRAFSETVNIVSTFTRQIAQVRDFIENIISSDSLDRSIGRIRAFTNTIVTSDAFVAFISLAIGFTETVTVAAGTFVRVVDIKRVLSESTTVGDAMALAHAFSRDFTETITVTAGTFSRALHTQRAFNEPAITTADTWERQIELTRVFTDTITVGAGSFVRNIVMSRAFAETVVLTDTVISSVGKMRTFIENVILAESWSRFKALQRAISNTITTSDAFSTFRFVTVSFTENISSTDSLSRSVAKMRTITDNILVGSSVAVRKVLQRTFNNTVVLTDSFLKNLGIHKAFSEIVNISSSFARIFGAERTTTDSITVSGLFDETYGHIRTFTDNVTVSAGTFVKSMTIQRVFSEVTSLSQSFTRRIGLSRAFSESTTVNAVIDRVLGLKRAFSNTSAVSDTFLHIREFFRDMIEPGIAVASIISVKKTFGRAFSNTVIVVDHFYNFRIVDVAFTENVLISDNWVSQRFITRWKRHTTPSTMLLYFIIAKWPEDGSINPKRSEIDFGTGSRYTGMSDVSINVHAPRGPQDFITIGDSKKHKISKCEVEIYVRDTSQPEFPELMWNIRDYLRRFLRENRASLFDYTIDVIAQQNVRSTRVPSGDQMTDLWRTVIDVDLIYQEDF